MEGSGLGADTHCIDYKSSEASVGARALVEKYGAEYTDAVLFERLRK